MFGKPVIKTTPVVSRKTVKSVTVGLCLGIAAIGLAVVGGASTAQATPVCGPGAHWIDACAAGSDTFWSSATVGVDLDFDSAVDVTLVLSGPTTVLRSGPLDDSVTFPGLRTGDGHLDVIDTEIISLTLTGAPGFNLRAGAGSIASGLPSLGAIAEDPTDNTIGDSFFDVFFEIDIPGMTLFNQNALHLDAQILFVPPLGFDYVHPLPGPVPLFDVAAPLGPPVAQLINAVHTPIPEPASLAILGLGLAGLGFVRRRRNA